MSDRGRLTSIDSLRGVAALGVAFFHLHALWGVTVVWSAATFAPALVDAIGSYGYVGVWLFFVISGFCIHMRRSVQQAKGEAGHVDFLAFWRRRIRRLYPPYLLALAFYLAWAIPRGELRLDGFFAWDTLLHLLMLHNLDPRTVFSLNGVFWTLAIEEQLYLAYFLLLRLRDRLGWTVTLGVCASARLVWFGLGFALHRAWGIDIVVTESALAQWFTWALGAFAVECVVGLVRLPNWCLRLFPGVIVLSLAVLVANRVHGSGLAGPNNVAWLLVDPLWGIGFFFVVVWLVRKETAWVRDGRVPIVVRLLAPVGLISYSLYLVHELVYGLLGTISTFEIAPLALTDAIHLVAAVVCAAAYFWFVERPFMNRPSRRVRGVVSAEVSVP